MNKALGTTIAAGVLAVGGIAVATAYANQPESPRAQVTHAVEKLAEPTTVTVANNTWQTLEFAPRGSVNPLVIEPGDAVQVDSSALTATGNQLSGKVVYAHGVLNVKASTPVAGKSSIQVGKDHKKVADGTSVTFVNGKHSVDVERSDDNGAKDLQITINS